MNGIRDGKHIVGGATGGDLSWEGERTAWAEEDWVNADMEVW